MEHIEDCLNELFAAIHMVDLTDEQTTKVERLIAEIETELEI